MCNKVRIVHHFRPDSSAASLFYGWCMHECADALRDRLCLEEGSRPALRLSIMKRSLYTISQARSLSIPYRSAHFRYTSSRTNPAAEVPASTAAPGKVIGWSTSTRFVERTWRSRWLQRAFASQHSHQQHRA
jgi:hypothetical protein